MNERDLRSILDALAVGDIDTATASRLIDQLKQAPNEADSKSTEPSNEELGDQAPYGNPSPSERSLGVDRVSIHAVGRKVRVIADSAVATVAASGHHVLRRNRNILEVTGESEGFGFEGFSILNPPRNWDEFRGLGIGKELVVRVNPAITLDVEITGGALSVQGVPRLGKIRVTASNATVKDFREISDILIQAGSANLSGRINAGRSRIRCESGHVKINLDSDSNVSIHSDSQLGKVSWSPAQDMDVDEVILGSGAGRLDVGVVMGRAHIKTGEYLR